MYKILLNLSVLGLLSFTSMIQGNESDFITYDWLIDFAQKTKYTDHIPHFRRLFNTMKVRGFLECGCGYSTKYFIDHSDKVISIEFMNPETNDLWFNKCLDLYKDCPNWNPFLYNADHKDISFNKACSYQITTHKDYSLIETHYLDSLDQYFKNQLDLAHQEGNDIDVAFVDPGVYIRGDMVNILLANRVPIVMAHDTKTDVGSNVDVGLYGWYKVKTPSDYVKIYIPFQQGTTFWVNKNLPNVIKSIEEYRDNIIILKSRNETTLPIERLKEIADQI